MRSTFFIFLVIAFVSCSRKDEGTSTLFNVDSLISAQVQILSAQKAKLNKTSSLDGEMSTISIIPSGTPAWKKELEIFNMLSVINKPINKSQYRIEVQADQTSNLKIKAFTNKSNLSVSYLKIYYQDSMAKIRKIKAEYIESNTLYKSKRILEMEFQPLNDKMTLTSYRVEGTQTMFIGDSVHYKIDTTVIIFK